MDWKQFFLNAGLEEDLSQQYAKKFEATGNRQHRLYVAQVAPGVGVFVPIFCPTQGALACICHGSCDKCPWVPGGRPLGMAADTRINLSRIV